MHHIVAPEISHGVAAVNAEGSFELFRRPDVDDVIGRRHSDLTVNPSMAPKKQLMSFRGSLKFELRDCCAPAHSQIVPEKHRPRTFMSVNTIVVVLRPREKQQQISLQKKKISLNFTEKKDFTLYFPNKPWIYCAQKYFIKIRTKMIWA